MLGPAGLLSLQSDAQLTSTTPPPCPRQPQLPSAQDHSRAHAWEQHHQLSNLPKYSSYQVTGKKKSLLLLMLLMENFSPFAAAFKASGGFIQTLSCAEMGEVEAQRERCKTGREQIMRNRGELISLSSSPPVTCAQGQSPGSKSYLPHLLAGSCSPTSSCKESLPPPRSQ